jgi:uncharacterized membrane protein YvbJ
MFCYKCGQKQNTDSKFCSSCGTSFPMSNNSENQKNTDVEIKKNKRGAIRKILFSLLIPPVFIFIIISIWGLANVLSATFDNEPAVFTIVNLLVPILVGLSVLAIPVGIVFAIYFYLRRNEN